MSKVTFDGPNRLILVNVGVVEIDVQSEIYSAWKSWTQENDNLKYQPAFEAIGGNPTVAGQRLDATYFLINGWRIKPYPGEYSLNLIGNIFDINGDDIKVPADISGSNSNNITVNLTTSVIVRQVDSTSVSTPGNFDPDQIVSASLFGSQLDALLTPPNVSASFDPTTIVSSSLFGLQEATLYNIENRVLSVQSILSSPLTASLDVAQSNQLTNIENYSISASGQLETNTEYLISQSQAIQNLNSLNVSQSLMLGSLVQTNTSQSIQLGSLIETNTSQSLQLSSLESQLIDVLTILNSVSTGSLLSDNRIREIWELHGLDSTKPLNVTRTARTFGSVSQTISTVGTGSSQDTTITRV